MIKRISGSFVEWCVSVVNSDDYVILDCESTGLSKADQIVELAIINVRGIVLYDRILKPSCSISEAAASVHHITEEIASSWRSFADEWPDIERAIAGRSIITWNAAFDARMMMQTARANGMVLKLYKIQNINFYCAMLEYTDHYGLRKWARLTEACSTLGIDFAQDHRALSDVFATLEVLRAMASKAQPQRRSERETEALES